MVVSSVQDCEQRHYIKELAEAFPSSGHWREVASLLGGTAELPALTAHQDVGLRAVPALHSCNAEIFNFIHIVILPTAFSDTLRFFFFTGLRTSSFCIFYLSAMLPSRVAEWKGDIIAPPPSTFVMLFNSKPQYCFAFSKKHFKIPLPNPFLQSWCSEGRG